MALNQFNFYSQVANNETRVNQEYERTLELIRRIEECKTIKQIKGFLKKELGITECVNNQRLGTLGYLSTRNNEKYFEVNISYSDEVHICVFPKQEERGVV